MIQENYAQEITYAQNLMLALEVGTKKEDKRLTDSILSRYGISRPRLISSRRLIDKLSHLIVAGPGFEVFFLDVVRCMRPFALMLQDVFGFLAKYATTTERRSSSVRVSRHGAARAFDFDLSGFPKEQLERILRVRGRSEILRLTPRAKNEALRNVWESSNCWRGVHPVWDGDFYDNGFYRALSYASTILSRGEGDRETIADLVGPVIARLTALVQILKWPELFPDQKGDHRENVSYMNNERSVLRWSLPKPFGSRLEREDTNQALLAAGQSVGVNQQTYWMVLEDIGKAVSIWNQEDFRRLDHRDWLSERLKMPFEVISFRHYMSLLKEETAKIEAALGELVIVDRVESFEEQVRVTLDFLRLPFWRDRWFLYELWTVAHVLDIGAAAWSLRLLSLTSREDGGLEWVLPGSDAKQPIAVLEGRMGSVECWSQRKTYHPTTGKGLEPDLRLTRASEGNEDIIVIENKDRIKPGKRKMMEIIERYVTGTQAKAIWLVNYEEFTSPTHTIGGKWSEHLVFVESHFRPGEVSERFSQLLRLILSEELGSADSTEPPGSKMSETETATEELGSAETAESLISKTSEVETVTTVTLTWQKPPNDLDLHAWIRIGKTLHHVDFHNRGRLGELPFVWLDTDCRQSPGREELVVEKILSEEIEIAIHQFSNDGMLGASQASVEIRRPGRGVTTLSAPASNPGRWWRICTLVRGGNMIIWNEVTVEPPEE